MAVDAEGAGSADSDGTGFGDSGSGSVLPGADGFGLGDVLGEVEGAGFGVVVFPGGVEGCALGDGVAVSGTAAAGGTYTSAGGTHPSSFCGSPDGGLQVGASPKMSTATPSAYLLRNFCGST